MQDANYFRAQADLCLDIARQMSDGHVGDSLRGKSAQYFARAIDKERQVGPSQASDKASSTHTRSSIARRFFFPTVYDGIFYEDDRGEVLLTVDEAKAYAAAVARELSQDKHSPVTVYLVGEDGTQIGKFRTPRQ